MANNGDHDSERERWPKRARISSRIVFWSINGEQNSPENQTADKQQLDQPGDTDGFLQSSVNRGGIPQLTQPRFGQRGASNFIDQGREQPQALIQQQPGTSRGKKRRYQQSAPDSHSPEIRQTSPEDKLARKRLTDKRYRDRIKLESQRTKANLENVLMENEQLFHEYQKMKSNMEKVEAENRQLKAENGLLRQYQEMGSYVVELEAENRYSSRKINDTFRSTQGSGPPQSSTSGFQDVGPSVQPYNFNPFDDWSHNGDNGVDELGELFSMGNHTPIHIPEDWFQNEDMQLNRSHEVLENEDMQHMPQLLGMEGHASMSMPEDWCTFYPHIPSPMSRSPEMVGTEDMQFLSWQFSMEGQASINRPEDGYTSPPYMPPPMPNFDEERSHTGKIIIGWLKIRAVIKWGSVTKRRA